MSQIDWFKIFSILATRRRDDCQRSVPIREQC